MATQLFRGYANALFEFARKMATAQTKMTCKLFDGDAAFTAFYGFDGFSGYHVFTTIGCKSVDQMRIDGVDARFDCLAIILNMFDKFAPLATPEVIHIRRSVDQFMRRIFKKGVAAARLKTDPEQIDRTGRSHPHRPAHWPGNPIGGYSLNVAVAIDDLNRCRQIEDEFKAFS